jgi:hypothetical protein
MATESPGRIAIALAMPETTLALAALEVLVILLLIILLLGMVLLLLGVVRGSIVVIQHMIQIQQLVGTQQPVVPAMAIMRSITPMGMQTIALPRIRIETIKRKRMTLWSITTATSTRS